MHDDGSSRPKVCTSRSPVRMSVTYALVGLIFPAKEHGVDCECASAERSKSRRGSQSRVLRWPVHSVPAIKMPNESLSRGRNGAVCFQRRLSESITRVDLEGDEVRFEGFDGVGTGRT